MEIIKTKEAFDKVLMSNKDKVVIADFFAEWCGPCKALLPTLEKINDENDNILVVKVDVDDASELSAEYAVRSIPTLVYFKNGEKKAVSVGLNDKSSIIKKTEELD